MPLWRKAVSILTRVQDRSLFFVCFCGLIFKRARTAGSTSPIATGASTTLRLLLQYVRDDFGFVVTRIVG